MSVLTCAGCSTQYARDLSQCPHCGSVENEETAVSRRRVPLFTTAHCFACDRRWNMRLAQVQPGLIQLSSLFCASCGGQVQVPWPPVVEDDMPKITVHGGPTNARDGGPSPAASASEPLDGAEAVQGRPADDVDASPEREAVFGEALPEVSESSYGPDAVDLDEVQVETEVELPDEVVAVTAPDYDGMTLAELKAAADKRGVPAYGTKAQIAERLREADAE